MRGEDFFFACAFARPSTLSASARDIADEPRGGAPPRARLRAGVPTASVRRRRCGQRELRRNKRKPRCVPSPQAPAATSESRMTAAAQGLGRATSYRQRRNPCARNQQQNKPRKACDKRAHGVLYHSLAAARSMPGQFQLLSSSRISCRAATWDMVSAHRTPAAAGRTASAPWGTTRGKSRARKTRAPRESRCAWTALSTRGATRRLLRASTVEMRLRITTQSSAGLRDIRRRLRHSQTNSV